MLHWDDPWWRARMMGEGGQRRRFPPALRAIVEKPPSDVSCAGSSNEEQTICEDAVEVCNISARISSLQLNGLLSFYQKTYLRPGISDLFEGDLGSDSAAALPVYHTPVLYTPDKKSEWKRGEQWQLPSDFTWRQALSIDDWACLNFSSIQIIETLKFLYGLCHYMEFTSEPTILCSNTHTDSENTPWGMFKIFVQVLEERKWKLQLLIVILPDIRDFDVKLERICKEFPFSCALFMPLHVRGANSLYLEHAALYIQTKILNQPECPPPIKKMLPWSTAFINLFEAKMGEAPLKPPQQISEIAEEDEKKVEEEKEMMEAEEQEGECGLDEMVGEDDDSVLFGPEDIRDSDSDSFYLEELQSSIDEMEYCSFVDSESVGDIFSQMEDDIFGQMEDDYFDKVSDDFIEEYDGQQADGGIEDEPSSAGKPIEEEANILGDDDVVQEFNPFPIDEAQAAPTDIERTLSNLTKCGRKEEQLEILLMILPEDEYSNGKVKKVCANLGVTFYYCYASEAMSPSKGTLKSIAYEIQSKVVMRDAHLWRLALPLVSEAPMLIFGVEIVRCTPGNDNSDFIASVATSLDWPKFRRYHIGLSHDEGTTNLSARIGSLISEFINSFSNRGKGNVEKIIFFRNGLKDGQFGDICHQEMSAIKKACAYFIHGYQLDITYVVVLPHASMGMADKSGPGADPSGYKFLCCHSGGKKFSSLACYHVVHDDNDFLPGELQSLTSKLCGIRDRRYSPEINIVPPAYYAKRAGMASLEEWGKNEATDEI